jgi:hypothetical protein
VLNAYAASQVRLLCKRVTGRPEPSKRARRSGQPFWSSPAFQIHTLPWDVFAYAVLANTRYALVEGNRCCLASYAAVMALSVRHGMAWHGIVSTVRVSVAAVSSACHVTFRAAQEIAGIAFGAGTSIVACIRPASFRAELT